MYRIILALLTATGYEPCVHWALQSHNPQYILHMTTIAMLLVRCNVKCQMDLLK